MSEKSDVTQGETPEAQSNEAASPPAAEFPVGPGRPPVDTRWKKGGLSPNPDGRPRKDRSMLPDVKKLFEQAINKKVAVPRGDKKVLMTRLEIGVEQQLNQFAKGDRHALKALMELADRLEIDFLAKHKQAIEEVLAPSHQAIIDSALARRSGAEAAAPEPRVLAPPDLLDDDLAEPEPTPQPPPAPEPEPEPPQKPGVTYPKPFSRMTWTEKRAWYPEWYAKKPEEAQEKQRVKEKAKAEAEQNQAKQHQSSIKRHAARVVRLRAASH